MKNLTQKFQQSMIRRIGKASIRSNSGLHISISLSPSTPAELFPNDPFQKGGNPDLQRPKLASNTWLSCCHLAFPSVFGRQLHNL